MLGLVLGLGLGRVRNIHDRRVHDRRVYSGSVPCGVYGDGRVRSMQARRPCP